MASKTQRGETWMEREALDVTGDPILKKMLAEERVESRWLDSALMGRLVSFIRPHKGLSLMAFGMATLEALMMTLPAYAIGLAIDRVDEGRSETRSSNFIVQLLDDFGGAFLDLVGPLESGGLAGTLMVYFGVVVLGLWLLRWFLAVSTTYVVQKLGQLVVHDLRVKVYGHLMGMDLNFFHHNPVGRLVNRTTFDVEQISELFSDALAQGMRDLLFIVVLIIVMLSLDWPLGLILLGTFPWLVMVGLLYRRLARPALRTNTAVRSRMNSWLAENLAGMRENHLYRKENRRRAEYDLLTQAHQNSITHVIRSWGILRPGMMLVSGIATTFVLIVGYDRVVEGTITLGILLTFLQYTAQIWRPIRSLTEKFNMIQTALTAGERIFDILESRPSIGDLKAADERHVVTRGEIEFSGVSFNYPSKTEPVLNEVDFKVSAGQVLALVGDTGAGKSTIAHLISRFYDATQGKVMIDGVDAREYQLKKLRAGIAIVPQDVVVFAGTVRENITLGVEVDEQRLRECVEAVRAHTFIERLPGGLDHVMEEGGRTLSTGERQLLSFARALVFNPPILILDEATANVDTQTELLIQQALNVLTQGRTSVVIAHRLSTVRDADQILVIRGGDIIERGSHAALMAQEGEYARLVQLHMRES